MCTERNNIVGALRGAAEAHARHSTWLQRVHTTLFLILCNDAVGWAQRNLGAGGEVRP